MNISFSAPGRMDVVEWILSQDSFFKAKMASAGSCTLRNRRGVNKTYSKLTLDLVNKLAEENLDAVVMRQSEVIAKAYELTELGEKRQLVS